MVRGATGGRLGPGDRLIGGCLGDRGGACSVMVDELKLVCPAGARPSGARECLCGSGPAPC